MSDRAILARPPLPPGDTRPYGREPHQVYEVFAPPADQRPRASLVLVHGGFWRAEWDRTHLRPLAAALAGEGYAVALVEYVRSGMPGGGWPGTFEDVAAGLSAVRADLAPEAEDRVLLVGHSAGGHLAAWLLHRPEAAPEVGAGQVLGAVSLAGCLDLAMVAELGLDDGAAVDLMGSTPVARPEDWSAADPTQLGPTPYPLVVVHGAADEMVPLEVARSWWSRCGTPGRDVLEVLEDVGHFALIDPSGPCWPVLLGRLEALLAAR